MKNKKSEAKEEPTYNGMTKDEYAYVFGLTQNHPNQELILNFVREMLKKTQLWEYESGWQSAMSRAKKYLEAVANGTDYKMEGGMTGFQSFMYDQWEKIPTTEDKVNRVLAAKAVQYIGSLKNPETQKEMIERINVPRNKYGTSYELDKRSADYWAAGILSGTRGYTMEMVELGEERQKWRNDHGCNDWNGGQGWGNYAAGCKYPRCVTGKLMKPGDIIVRRRNTEERRANDDWLYTVFPVALDSWDEVREGDEIISTINENWDIVRYQGPKTEYNKKYRH